MGRKTSFYLSDDDDALLREALAAGDSLREIMRRGIGAVGPVEATAELAARRAAEAVEARIGDIESRLAEIVERSTTRALHDYRG